MNQTMISVPPIVGIVLVAWSAVEVQAFLCNHRVRVSPPSFAFNLKNSCLSPRFALVYGADGELSSTEEETIASVLDSASKVPPDVFKSLSSMLTMPLLARLGCAFAPPPYTKMHPNNIESATLVSMGSTKLEIAVAIPSDGGLVQLLVSLVFPSPCESNEDLEACLMDTVQKLDSQAMETIGDSEREHDNHEEVAHQQRILQAMKEEPYVDELPEWWTFPELKIALEEECKSMKGLLNEDDFASDLQALCRVHCADGGKILHASVAAVGPSGLFLRARVEKQTNQYDNIDVIIPFPMEATTGDALRTVVLELVESVEVPAPVAPDVEGSEVEEEQEADVSAPVASAEEEEVEETPEISEDTPVAEESTEEESRTEEVEEEEALSPKENPTQDDVARARKQPKSSEHAAKLAAKYAAIEDLEERAFTILKDLYMI